MCKKLFAVVSLLTVSHTALCGDATLVHIGVMSHDCSEFKSVSGVSPKDLHISVVEAAKVVKASSKYGCFIKLGLGVYTEGSHYYFSNNNTLFGKSKSEELIKRYSFVVDASTGRLVSTPAYDQ